jgi:hypothetical protein
MIETSVFKTASRTKDGGFQLALAMTRFGLRLVKRSEFARSSITSRATTEKQAY